MDSYPGEWKGISRRARKIPIRPRQTWRILPPTEILNFQEGRDTQVNTRIRFAASILACIFLVGASSAVAQQKPQWMPGQIGLNAGILPSPGFTYANIDINYDAGTFNGPNGKAVPVTGTYNVGAVENACIYVPHFKFLGGNLGFQLISPTIATGSLDADIRFPPASGR